MVWTLLIPLAMGREVLLRNDQAWDDRYDEADEVVHLTYPQCAVSVLEPEPEQLPITVHTVLVYLGSSLGNQDRQSTMLTMAMQVLEEGEEPRVMGYNDWDWPETAFYVTVSSENYNALYLDDGASGIYPLVLDHGRLAVFVCAPDPDWEGGYAWPCEVEGEDCSGLVVETGSPSEGSWVVTTGPEAEPIEVLGVQGAWVIRALGETEHRLDSGDTAGPEPGETASPDTSDPGESDPPDEGIGCSCASGASASLLPVLLLPLLGRRRQEARGRHRLQ
jgi:hypothetical protein